MALLSASDFLAFKPEIVTVPLPEMGGEVAVAAMTVARRIDLLNHYLANHEAVEAWNADQARAPEDREGVPEAKLVDDTILTAMYSIVDADGEPVFARDQYDLVMAMPYSAIARIVDAVSSLAVVKGQETAKKKSTTKSTRN